MSKERLLYVEWEDACSFDNTWGPKQRYEGHLDYIQSVGFVVAETKKSITLCASKAQSGNYCSDITIPKSCIRKKKIL